ncbi:MAG: hypothetical protein IT453_01950 [Planctomycetes bacterium]|nr:hypothetical protein [Planctomycetota bacterium]
MSDPLHPEHNSTFSPPAPAGSSKIAADRRQLLVGLAALLASSPALARGLASSRTSRAAGAAGPNAPTPSSAYDALFTLSAACDYDLIASRVPLLHTTALAGAGGGAGQALAAVLAALDVLENLVAGGISTLGPDILVGLMHDEITYRDVVMKVAPEADELQQRLKELGLTNADLNAAFSHFPSFTLGKTTKPLDGLATISAAQLQQIRGAASTLIVSKPTQCLFAVEAAALAGVGVMSIVDGGTSVQSALFSAFAGTAFTGVAAQLLP